VDDVVSLGKVLDEEDSEEAPEVVLADEEPIVEETVVEEPVVEEIDKVTPAAEQVEEYMLIAADSSDPVHLLVMLPSKAPDPQRALTSAGLG